MIVWTESCQRLRTDALVQGRYGGNGAWSSTGGRNNGPRIWMGSYLGGLVTPLYPAPSGSLFLAGARLCALPMSYNFYFSPAWNGTRQLGIQVDPGGTISVVGSSTLASINAAYDGAVRYLSVAILISATVGSVRVYLDGVLLSALSQDNINTKLVAGGLWNGFLAGGMNAKFCDLLVADGTDPSGAGYDLHDIWMDARVDYLPVNGNGYSSQFVGSDGNSVDNYALLSEVTPDDDATYVQSADPAIDGYTKTACPVPGATILGAAVYARGRKTDAGVAVAKVGLRSGSTNLESNAQALPTSYVDVYGHFGHDPANGAFTRPSLDAMQIILEKT